ncbi:MAG: hypothetical protein E6G97_13255 [Alphaproteobacteria bacterium]|nr:MAG: hypothetical protein E6G97_13255 [Alphaproteobacteria bacterium]
MPAQSEVAARSGWRRFVLLFLAIFASGMLGAALFILLLDPYDMVPFSLPIERPLVSGSQRFAYPQVMRSKRFDSIIVGSSTARLIDPEQLNGPFGARFANMAMNASSAWEQWTTFEYFRRNAGAPKVLIVGVDDAWCDPNAYRHRLRHGFPEWMYDDDRWNDYANLFNSGTLELAARLAGYHLGLYRARSRYDGFEVFTPPERDYDLTRARPGIWTGRTPQPLPDAQPPALRDDEKRALQFPALAWMDTMLGELPASTIKVLAFMPVHVAAQAWPGTRDAAVEAECKARIAAIARAHGAKLVDWRIASPITTNDANYWDGLHYRLPIARRVADELIGAVLNDRESADGDYRLVVR